MEDVPLSTERPRAWLDSTLAQRRGAAPDPARHGGVSGRAHRRGPDLLHQRQGTERQEAPARPPNRRGSQGDTILPHRVKGLDQIYARLQAEGFEVLFAPRTSGTGLSRNMMVFDPNGNIVELFEMK